MKAEKAKKVEQARVKAEEEKNFKELNLKTTEQKEKKNIFNKLYKVGTPEYKSLCFK